MSRQAEARAAALPNVGRRCRWAEPVPPGTPEFGGTIRDVVVGAGGWAQYVVAWDEGAPSWWTRHVSTAAGQFFVIEQVSDGELRAALHDALNDTEP